MELTAKSPRIAGIVAASGETNLLQSSLTRAVLFSALTTATALGSLWLSTHPGTASMGKLLMISLGWTLVTALLFEPALLGSHHKIGPKSDLVTTSSEFADLEIPRQNCHGAR